MNCVFSKTKSVGISILPLLTTQPWLWKKILPSNLYMPPSVGAWSLLFLMLVDRVDGLLATCVSQPI